MREGGPIRLDQPQRRSHILGMPGFGQRLKTLLRRTFEEPRRNAHLKGMQLLSENLSPAQQDQLKLFNYIEVIGGDTGKRYRIYFDRQMNVELLNESGNLYAHVVLHAKGLPSHR